MLLPPFKDQLLRFQAEPVLFAERVNQIKLRQQPLPELTQKSIKANIWRNHTFESIGNLSQMFARAYGIELNLNYSEYDSSLSFSNYSTADIEIVWLNPEEYDDSLSPKSWTNWFKDRVSLLRQNTKSPILIITWSDGPVVYTELQKAVRSIPDIHPVDLSEYATSKNLQLINSRTKKLAGTPVDSAVLHSLSRTLFCKWISSCCMRPIKAIALDLDNTLHHGVLAEDGIEGIEITDAHAELQKAVLSYKERGVFLALVSRNEEDDVRQLLRENKAYILKESDFSAFCVSWQSKSEALREISEKLRIGQDSILFVDDNIGELSETANAEPAVQLIAAHQDASVTKRAIEFHPGVWQWTVTHEDKIRAADLAANEIRQSLQSTSDNKGDYFRNIGAKLSIYRNPGELLERLASMSVKTNQFNLALRRLTKTDIDNAIISEDQDVIAVGMKDNLSDSGIIAFLVISKTDELLTVEELCISCRALGRGLENTIISEAIKFSTLMGSNQKLRFKYVIGPRNAPALKWLENFTECQLSDATLEVTLPASVLYNLPLEEGIVIEKQ